MGSKNFPLRESGIYRNLPSYDSSIKDLSAIVCGASGISGFNAIRALLDDPHRWTAVYAISRSPLKSELLNLLGPDQRSRIKHVSIDLGTSAERIANALKDANVQASHVFFFAYLQPTSALDPGSAHKLTEANVPLLRNFLDALPLAAINPKRILLQTGGKNYGMHIGRVRTPLVESDPQPKHLQENFYYEQEKVLFDYCRTLPETSWNVVRPAGIIGAVPGGAINMIHPFAVYAATQQQKGEPLSFGGDFESWQFEAAHSTARLTGYLCEWAVLEDECANQDFNAQDGSPLSWDRFFHELARWYGVEKGVVGPVEDETKYMTIPMAGGKNAPLGYGPPLTLRLSFALRVWARDPANKKAWEEVMAASDGELTDNPFEGDVDSIMMGDFGYLRYGTLSMNKARRFGWNGFVDSLESMFEAYHEFASFGMLPPMRVDSARPSI